MPRTVTKLPSTTMSLPEKIRSLLRLAGRLPARWQGLLDDAQDAAEQAAHAPPPPLVPPPSLGSELDKHPDFWSRAAQFVDASTPPDPSPPTEGRLSIRPVPVEKKPSTHPVKGMEDLDQDGNPLIDDAILLDDEPSADT